MEIHSKTEDTEEIVIKKLQKARDKTEENSKKLSLEELNTLEISVSWLNLNWLLHLQILNPYELKHWVKITYEIFKLRMYYQTYCSYSIRALKSKKRKTLKNYRRTSVVRYLWSIQMSPTSPFTEGKWWVLCHPFSREFLKSAIVIRMLAQFQVFLLLNKACLGKIDDAIFILDVDLLKQTGKITLNPSILEHASIKSDVCPFSLLTQTQSTSKNWIDLKRDYQFWQKKFGDVSSFTMGQTGL